MLTTRPICLQPPHPKPQPLEPELPSEAIIGRSSWETANKAEYLRKGAHTFKTTVFFFKNLNREVKALGNFFFI